MRCLQLKSLLETIFSLSWTFLARSECDLLAVKAKIASNLQCTPIWPLDLKNWIDGSIPMEVHWGTADSACLRIDFWQGCTFDLALFATLSTFHRLFFCLYAECEDIIFSEPEIHRSTFETQCLWIFTWKGSAEAKHNLNWTCWKKKPVQFVFWLEYSKVGKESLIGCWKASIMVF